MKKKICWSRKKRRMTTSWFSREKKKWKHTKSDNKSYNNNNNETKKKRTHRASCAAFPIPRKPTPLCFATRVASACTKTATTSNKYLKASGFACLAAEKRSLIL